MTIEDLMRERGQLVKKGTLSEDGDVEFWEDGTSNKRGEGQGLGVLEKEEGVKE
jgi:protein import protein ZIM17